jgi:alpha-tubulin suppressor-like RCC1 family protein
MGDNLRPIPLGAGVVPIHLGLGTGNTCVVSSDKRLKCWGRNYTGQLGLGDGQHRGDNPGEMGDALPVVDLGRGVGARAVDSGQDTICALLERGQLKCWGAGNFGQLGFVTPTSRGAFPGDMGDNLPYAEVGTGRTALHVGVGYHNVCALLDDRSVKCWGWNSWGQLGLGDTETRGDQPGEMGDELPPVDLGR